MILLLIVVLRILSEWKL